MTKTRAVGFATSDQGTPLLSVRAGVQADQAIEHAGTLLDTLERNLAGMAARMDGDGAVDGGEVAVQLHALRQLAETARALVDAAHAGMGRQ